MFNGRMSLDEKEEAVRSFKASDQILISTEAGGEGRNFQFCHLMVNYDLPWNPMRVEQRIGRLDRIGQKRPVRIYNLFCEDTVEERVLEVLEQRIGLFQESVGSLDPILGEVERDIERLVLSDAASLRRRSSSSTRPRWSDASGRPGRRSARWRTSSWTGPACAMTWRSSCCSRARWPAGQTWSSSRPGACRTSAER